jgi:hypothetical protein
VRGLGLRGVQGRRSGFVPGKGGWAGLRKKVLPGLAGKHGAGIRSPWSSSGSRFPLTAANAAYETAVPGSALVIKYAGRGGEIIGKTGGCLGQERMEGWGASGGRSTAAEHTLRVPHCTSLEGLPPPPTVHARPHRRWDPPRKGWVRGVRGPPCLTRFISETVKVSEWRGLIIAYLVPSLYGVLTRVTAVGNRLTTGFGGGTEGWVHTRCTR